MGYGYPNSSAWNSNRYLINTFSVSVSVGMLTWAKLQYTQPYYSWRAVPLTSAKVGGVARGLRAPAPAGHCRLVAARRVDTWPAASRQPRSMPGHVTRGGAGRRRGTRRVRHAPAAPAETPPPVGGTLKTISLTVWNGRSFR